MGETNTVEISLIRNPIIFLSVKDKEEGPMDSEARPMKDETFGEYRFVILMHISFLSFTFFFFELFQLLTQPDSLSTVCAF